jgi:hypothetical protein
VLEDFGDSVFRHDPPVIDIIDIYHWVNKLQVPTLP